MAYLKTMGQIDFYTTSPNVSCGITSTGVIAGTGSLRVWRGTGTTFLVQAARNSTPYRFLSGYGYLRWKLLNNLPINSGARLGYYFLASQADMCAGTGQCYSAWIFLDFSRINVFINLYPNGLNGTSTTGVGTPNLPAPVLGTVYSFAVKWIVDIPRYGGLWVRCWTHTGPDLPDTTTPPVQEYTFPLSVQPSSLGEGEWMRNQDNNNMDFIIDQVGRYALLVP